MRLLFTLFFLAVGHAGFAQQTVADLDRAVENAKRELSASTDQLEKLREQLLAQRMPLADELAALETRLLDLRKEYADVLRVLDTRNLDISNLKNEVKLKEDESFYLSNLMDEFVRGAETKLHPSEADQYRTLIERAKEAAGDAKMSIADKYARQLQAIEAALFRATSVIGGAHFDGQALDEKGQVQDGRFALIGPFAVFASKDGLTRGLAIAQSGSLKPVVKALSDDVNQGIAAVVEGGKGWFPLDATNGNALKALIHKSSLIDIYKHGGPIMHPLLIVSVLALAVVIERLTFLFVEKGRRRPQLVAEMLAAVEAGDLEKARRIGHGSKDFVARVLTYALEHREKGIGNALMLAANHELKRFARGIPVLDTSITIAPLLGLLGTVTGMMHSFSLIGGDLGAPGAITGGIAEALIATAFGLLIAITALVPFNYLNARTDDARHEIEAAATRLELLMKALGKGGPEPEESGGFKLAAPVAASGGGAH